MKRGILLLILLVLGVAGYSQNKNAAPQSGFAFPLGSKVRIQLVPVDSVNFNYRVLKFEEYHKQIDLDDDVKLISDSLSNDMIEFIFSYGIYSSDKKEKNQKPRIVLEIINGSTSILEYRADIKLPTKEFESTSVVALNPRVKTREHWPYIIDMIGLHSFHIKKKQ